MVQYAASQLPDRRNRKKDLSHFVSGLHSSGSDGYKYITSSSGLQASGSIFAVLLVGTSSAIHYTPSASWALLTYSATVYFDSGYDLFFIYLVAKPPG